DGAPRRRAIRLEPSTKVASPRCVDGIEALIDIAQRTRDDVNFVVGHLLTAENLDDFRRVDLMQPRHQPRQAHRSVLRRPYRPEGIEEVLPVHLLHDEIRAHSVDLTSREHGRRWIAKPRDLSLEHAFQDRSAPFWKYAPHQPTIHERWWPRTQAKLVQR